MGTEPLSSYFPRVIRETIGNPCAVEQRLSDALAAARARWPEVKLDPARYVAHLVDHLGEGDPEQALDQLCLEDLYLACACLASDPRALAAFNAEMLSVVDPALRRLRLEQAAVDEVKLALSEEVLVGVSGRAPLIGTYRGAGPLRSWLRIIAVRLAGRIVARTEKERPLEEEALEAISSGADPELDFLKRTYREHFRVAFTQALGTLSARQRNLLRQHHLDGLSVDKLAVLYGVHRATAARWVAQAREFLFEHTRAALQEQLRVSEAELDSIMRLIASRLSVTIPRFLRR